MAEYYFSSTFQWAGIMQMIGEKDRQLREKDRQLQEKDGQLQEKDRQLQEKDRQLQEKDVRLQGKDRQLLVKDLLLKEKDKRLQEKDLQLQEKDDQLKDMIKQLQVKNMKLDDLSRKLEHVECVVAHIHDKVCDDVVLSYTMTGFKQIKDNKDQWFGRKQWFSPPYFTHINGYKMCFEVDLKGIFEKSLYIYSYMMRGPYDNHLQWPFKGKVIVRLLNQCDDGDQYHYDYVFYYKYSDKGERVTSGELGDYLSSQTSQLPLDQLGYNPNTNCEYLKNDCLKFVVIVPP